MLPHLLSAGAVLPRADATQQLAQYIGDGLVVLIVFGKGLLDIRGGRRRDESVALRFERINGNIKELRAFLVGPDGENGFRGDLREMRHILNGLLDRERDRLAARSIPRFDRDRDTR